MNTFYQHRPSHKWTWYRWNSRDLIYNEKSTIDLFLTNKAIPSVSMDAYHRMVLAKIDVRVPKRKSGIERKRFKIVRLGNPEYVDRLRSRLGEMLQNIVEDRDIEAKWNDFKKKVTEAATDAVGDKVPYRGRKKTTPWWKENIRVSIKHKMNCFRRWMKTRRSGDRQSYVAARNFAESWKNIGEDLKKDMEQTKKLLFSLTKSYIGRYNELSYAMKNRNGELLIEPERIAERWREYFSELLNVQCLPKVLGTPMQW